MLLGLAAISAAGMEHLSFGHHHVQGDHAVHHHHVSSGAHDHHEPRPAGERGAPAQQDEAAPRRTVTVPGAPVLFQPAGVSVMEAPPAASALLVPVLVVPPRDSEAFQPSLPRGPPASPAGSDLETEAPSWRS